MKRDYEQKVSENMQRPIEVSFYFSQTWSEAESTQVIWRILRIFCCSAFVRSTFESAEASQAQLVNHFMTSKMSFLRIQKQRRRFLSAMFFSDSAIPDLIRDCEKLLDSAGNNYRIKFT